MVDADEQKLWYQAYLKESLKYPEARANIKSTKAWAMSMAKIADQHEDNDDNEPELVDAE